MRKEKQTTQQEEEKGKHKINNNKNPLSPLRRYMIDYSKVSEDIKQASDYSNDQIIKLMNQNVKNQQEVNPSVLLNSRLKLEEMITLGIIKG